MKQDYRIDVNLTSQGGCLGPSGEQLGQVEVCPDNSSVTFSCYQNNTQCQANSVTVPIPAQGADCLCSDQLFICDKVYETSAALLCPCTPLTCNDFTYDECPGETFDDGCGGTISCGNNCESLYSDQYECIAGICVCMPDCTDLDCGSDGCGGSCGTCGSCEYCNNGECTTFSSLIYFSTQPPSSYELGTNTDMYARFRYRNISNSDSPLIVSFINLSNGSSEHLYTEINTSYDCNSYQYVDLNINIEEFFESANLGLGNYKIKIKTQDGSPSTLSNQIIITDDDRPGCDDPCATNQDTNATINDGSCEYEDCLDALANNYICDGECGNSYYCTGDTYTSATDDGSCTFNPIAFINDITDPLFENNQITIVGNNSLAMPNESDYDTNVVISGYSWEVEDTDGNTWTGTGPQLGFTIPLYSDPTDEFGGGGIITAKLTIANSDGFSDEVERDFTIGDIDILGTQLSEFPPIYIPGGGAYSLIGSYLPPNVDGNNYDMIQLLNESFYMNNPDTGDTTPATFMTGDYVYVILCANENCAGSDENLDNGFFNYIGGIGWVGPNINLKPGMGIKLKTTNAGWFRWTLPEES